MDCELESRRHQPVLPGMPCCSSTSGVSSWCCHFPMHCACSEAGSNLLWVCFVYPFSKLLKIIFPCCSLSAQARWSSACSFVIWWKKPWSNSMHFACVLSKNPIPATAVWMWKKMIAVTFCSQMAFSWLALEYAWMVRCTILAFSLHFIQLCFEGR